MGYLTFAVTIILLFSYIGIKALNRNVPIPPGTKLPPGPKGKPLVGNLLDIPPYHSWLKFKKWADQYGSIFRLTIAGREHYVVSTEKIANDLLRERGTIYSSREQLPAAAQLLSRDLRPLLLPYDDTWRAGRRIMHLLTMTTVAESYQPTQIMESSWLLEKLIQAPMEYEQWLERYASGIIFRLAFGRRIVTGREEEVRRIYKVVRNVQRIASPGAYLVDTFPVLMHLPSFLAPFKKELEGLHQEELSLFRKLRDEVPADADTTECWEHVAVKKGEEVNLSPDHVAYVVGTLFEAGSGTTAAAMMSFLLAMVLHPEASQKLQEELDRVVGSNRLPEFEDLPNLPLVRATVKEVLRWRPVTAGGVPHQTTKDDVYNGILSPRERMAIHRDPELYPNPEEFLPERWLSPKYPTYREPLSTYPNLQNFSAFGFGRRICPGINIAERSLNILVARIAWACDISSKYDASGRPIKPPLYDYTTGFNVQPKPFDFDLKARSENHKRIVNEAAARARESDPLAGRG